MLACSKHNLLGTICRSQHSMAFDHQNMLLMVVGVVKVEPAATRRILRLPFGIPYRPIFGEGLELVRHIFMERRRGE
jgi:hypothetical protein